MKAVQEGVILTRIGDWFDFVIAFDVKLLSVVIAEVLKLRSESQFVFVFKGMERTVVKCRGRQEVIDPMRNAATYADNKCRKSAIALLGTGCDAQSLLKLASFPKDCPEAEKLAAELKGQSG